ncbi:MAG TPA: lactate utilization protein C [Burkholderiaceae bacterium]|nr:lactate utilization protein C [Burkholderiaceae bacterium]
MNDPFDTSAARSRILTRIRTAQGRGEPTLFDDSRNDDYLKRHPRGPQPAPYADVVTTFVERAERMASSVVRVGSTLEVPLACARYLDQQQLPMRAACWNTLSSFDWKKAGIDAEFRPPHEDDLVGISGSFCGIAETGTLLFLSGPNTPATTHLWPETHIAILERSRVVSVMEDAFDLMRHERRELPRAANFVSGPSRTGDIEQTIVLGAHGPYRVHIIVVG